MYWETTEDILVSCLAWSRSMHDANIWGAQIDIAKGIESEVVLSMIMLGRYGKLKEGITFELRGMKGNELTSMMK